MHVTFTSKENQPGEKSKDGNPFGTEAFRTGSQQRQRAAKINCGKK